MHVTEESHSGIVPMNHSNKDENASAESGEGRPLIKENVRQPNTSPTQSGERVSQGLAGVRKAAGNNKEMKFTALLHHLTVELLRESFHSLKRKAAPGVDGVTWQEYEGGLEDRLIDLHGRIHRGAYRATPWLASLLRAPRFQTCISPLGVGAVVRFEHRHLCRSAALPRGPSLRSGLCCPGPSTLNRPHPPHS